MLKDTLKKEIDNLNEEQLKQIADFVISLKTQKELKTETKPYWQSATPKARAQNFRQWVSQLPETKLSLPDEAFDRDSIYD